MTTTKELVIISQASQQIVQLFKDYEASSEQLAEQFRNDLLQIRRATLAKMEAIIGEEPELLILDRSNGESANERTRD